MKLRATTEIRVVFMAVEPHQIIAAKCDGSPASHTGQECKDETKEASAAMDMRKAAQGGSGTESKTGATASCCVFVPGQGIDAASAAQSVWRHEEKLRK